MKDLIAILLFCFGVMLSIYLGFWVCFVGGIIDIINSVKATPVYTLGVITGLLKFWFSGVVGWSTFWVFTAMSSATAK